MHVNAGALAQFKTNMTKRLNKRRQRGVTLVELAVAVAVMGLIMAGAMVGVPALMANVKLSQEIKDWQMSSLAVQSAVASGILTPTTSPQQIRDMAIAEPFNRPAGQTTILNRFGGRITITTLAGNGFPSSGVSAVSVGYPTKQCQEFASKMQGLFSTFSINGVDIKSESATALDKITDACSSREDSNGGTTPSTTADLTFTLAG